MKNRKVLNICLLTFALITLITFILPLKKFDFILDEVLLIKILFYLLNAIMLLMLVLIITLSIVSLFKDNYSLVKLFEGFALIGFLMVFFAVLCFAVLSTGKISAGYFIVAIEMFLCANFSQMARIIGSGKELKQEITNVIKPKNKIQVKNTNKIINKQTQNQEENFIIVNDENNQSPK